jgi:hypothetical protein
MRTMNQTSHRQTELDVLTKWSLVILILTALLTFGYSIIHYAAQVDHARSTLAATLPDNYRDTLKALVTSSGGSCRQVCDLKTSNISPARTTYRVSCGTGAVGAVCTNVHDYVLTIGPAPVPSR